MATIAFDGRVLNERGTTSAIYDYAEAVEQELGHKALILHQTGADAFNPGIAAHFARRFEPVTYTDVDDMRRKVRASGAEVLYAFNFTPDQDRRVEGVRNAAHVLFQHYRPRADVYAYISEWMADHMGGAPWVPHIVNVTPPDRSLRKDWGFPEDAVVLGRHGGYDQFDLPFVKGAVAEALERRRDLYFAFLNTEPFIQSERVKFIPTVYDMTEKSNFVFSCDAMLHGRKAGEGFGLAPAEFLALDKPVICWEGGKDRNHLWMIPDHRYVYRTATDLMRILLTFEPQPSTGYYRAAVEPFKPAAVARRFSDVFIEGPANGQVVPPWLRQMKGKLDNRSIVLRGRLWRDQGLRQLKAMAAERGAA